MGNQSEHIICARFWDQTRGGCEECDTRSFGRNRTRDPTIPVKRSEKYLVRECCNLKITNHVGPSGV